MSCTKLPEGFKWIAWVPASEQTGTENTDINPHSGRSERQVEEQNRENYFKNDDTNLFLYETAGNHNFSLFPSDCEPTVENQQVRRKTGAVAKFKALRELNKKKDRLIWRKKHKMPASIKRKKLNNKLSRIIVPKGALTFLHELKPGCTFDVNLDQRTHPPTFVANVEHNGAAIATAQGSTKAVAKTAAAENAIRAIIAESLSRRSRQGALRRALNTGESDPLCTEFSWAGLASFALHKMFLEWRSQGITVPDDPFLQPEKIRPPIPKSQPAEKILPVDAEKLHPSHLLNIMRPGTCAVEIGRCFRDNVSSVTMGFEIDGKIYTGTASNKKEAKKEAAKNVITALYGLKYTDSHE